MAREHYMWNSYSTCCEDVAWQLFCGTQPKWQENATDYTCPCLHSDCNSSCFLCSFAELARGQQDCSVRLYNRRIQRYFLPHWPTRLSASRLIITLEISRGRMLTRKFSNPLSALGNSQDGGKVAYIISTGKSVQYKEKSRTAAMDPGGWKEFNSAALLDLHHFIRHPHLLWQCLHFGRML